MSSIDVAIIGAGIGGLALAIGLIKQNVSCTIYEAAPRFDAVGAGIGLGPNALKAMELMDTEFAKLYEAIKVGNTSPERYHEQIEILSTEQGFGITSQWQGGSVSHPEFERSSAHRKALLEIMKSLIPDGTVLFNKRVSKMETTGRIVFEDGSIVQADVVVGCDGIKGMSRKTILADSPQEIAAKYVHTYVYRGIAPMAEAKKKIGCYAEDARWWMGHGKGWAMYPISQGAEVNIVIFVYDEDEWVGEQAVRSVSREDMLGDFGEFDDRLQALLDYVKPARWPLFHHPDTPTYYKGRLCMLGDVAHASSPSQAAGAGQGLEDALILSRLLGLVKDVHQVEAAIQVYDAIRRPRAQEVVRASAEVLNTYYLLDPVIGNDLEQITKDANARLPLIWYHDLDADIRRAKAMFSSLVNEQGKHCRAHM